MIRLSERAARYDQFARQLRAIDSADIAEEDRLQLFKPPLAEFISDPSIFPSHGFPLKPGSHGGLFRLVEHADRKATVYVSLGVTGGSQSPHRHRGWALVAGITGGVETNQVFEFAPGADEHTARLTLKRQVDVGPGDVAEIAAGEYHTIDVISDTPFLHIHAYAHSVDDPGYYSPAFASADSTTYELKSNAGFNPPSSRVSVDELLDDLAEGKVGVLLVDGAADEAALKGRYVVRAVQGDARAAIDSGALLTTLPLVIAAEGDTAQQLGCAAMGAGYPLVFLLA